MIRSTVASGLSASGAAAANSNRHFQRVIPLHSENILIVDLIQEHLEPLVPDYMR
jgi:hypothetical protein